MIHAESEQADGTGLQRSAPRELRMLESLIVTLYHCLPPRRLWDGGGLSQAERLAMPFPRITARGDLGQKISSVVESVADLAGLG
jgi:hypothetical protein